MSLVEYSTDDVDFMHLESAVFQSIHREHGARSVSFRENGITVNGYAVDIEDEDGYYIVDLSDVENADDVARNMSEIWDGERMFPNVYADDIPLDSIQPTHVDRTVPSDVESFFDSYREWVEVATIESLGEKVETAFFEDGIGNIVGVEYGTINSITWPTSMIENHGVRFHTHPEVTFLADPSVADLEILERTEGSVSADAIVSTYGTDEAFTLCYVVKVEDDDVDPEEEVENYIDVMTEMAVEELAISKHFTREGVIDADLEKFKGDGIEEMAKSRVDQQEKRDIIRQMASDGYRIEPSWGVIQ